MAAAHAYYRTSRRLTATTHGGGYTKILTGLAETVRAPGPGPADHQRGPTTGTRQWEIEQPTVAATPSTTSCGRSGTRSGYS